MKFQSSVVEIGKYMGVGSNNILSDFLGVGSTRAPCNALLIANKTQIKSRVNPDVICDFISTET